MLLFFLYKIFPNKMNIYSRIQLNYWMECKETYVLKRFLQNIQDTDLFPLLILRDENDFIEDTPNKNIKMYLYECESENILDAFKKKGFVHICNSKDDNPILMLFHH